MKIVRNVFFIELKMLGFFANTDDILVDVLITNAIVNQWGGKSSDVKGMYDYQKLKKGN